MVIVLCSVDFKLEVTAERFKLEVSRDVICVPVG
jgi:hypothetical protein